MARRHQSIDQFNSAAEAGTPDAQLRLGLIYSTGSGQMPLDYILAHKWLNIAARSGNDEARALRCEIAGDMSRDKSPRPSASHGSGSRPNDAMAQ